uniref:MADF domain-containing protein n=1 Tax=Knipowitschia caucasica TaxID=637954 RepID=A0AAV2J876_KNICA
MDDIRIIKAVEGFPELFSKGHPNYKDIRKKEITWQVIGAMLGLDGASPTLGVKSEYMRSPRGNSAGKGARLCARRAV